MADPLIGYDFAPINGPFATSAWLMEGVTAVAEGLWVPTKYMKNASVEISGSMTTMSLAIVGSNQLPEPPNQVTLTIGGSVTVGDTVTVVVNNKNIPAGGSASVSYTTIGGDTTSTVAAALATRLSASLPIIACGIEVNNIAAAVITVQFPSVWPNAGLTGGSYNAAFQNVTTFSGSSSGAATETVTAAAVTTIGTAIGSAVTALGFVSLSLVPRWMKARLTTLTGGGATINAAVAGPA